MIAPLERLFEWCRVHTYPTHPFATVVGLVTVLGFVAIVVMAFVLMAVVAGFESYRGWRIVRMCRRAEKRVAAEQEVERLSVTRPSSAEGYYHAVRQIQASFAASAKADADRLAALPPPRTSWARILEDKEIEL